LILTVAIFGFGYSTENRKLRRIFLGLSGRPRSHYQSLLFPEIQVLPTVLLKLNVLRLLTNKQNSESARQCDHKIKWTPTTV